MPTENQMTGIYIMKLVKLFRMMHTQIDGKKRCRFTRAICCCSCSACIVWQASIQLYANAVKTTFVSEYKCRLVCDSKANCAFIVIQRVYLSRSISPLDASNFHWKWQRSGKRFEVFNVTMYVCVFVWAFKNYRCCYRTSFEYSNVHYCVNGGCIFTQIQRRNTCSTNL